MVVDSEAFIQTQKAYNHCETNPDKEIFRNVSCSGQTDSMVVGFCRTHQRPDNTIVVVLVRLSAAIEHCA
jgi:hypothetical protein